MPILGRRTLTGELVDTAETETPDGRPVTLLSLAVRVTDRGHTRVDRYIAAIDDPTHREALTEARAAGAFAEGDPVTVCGWVRPGPDDPWSDAKLPTTFSISPVISLSLPRRRVGLMTEQDNADWERRFFTMSAPNLERLERAQAPAKGTRR